MAACGTGMEVVGSFTRFLPAAYANKSRIFHTAMAFQTCDGILRRLSSCCTVSGHDTLIEQTVKLQFWLYQVQFARCFIQATAQRIFTYLYLRKHAFSDRLHQTENACHGSSFNFYEFSSAITSRLQADRLPMLSKVRQPVAFFIYCLAGCLFRNSP